MHLLEPELHGMVHNFNWAALEYACAHRWEMMVPAGVNNALVVEANGARVDKACFDESFP